MRTGRKAPQLEQLFVGWMIASGDYMPPGIAWSRSAASGHNSVLLEQAESKREELGELVETASAFVRGIAVLPADAEADARIEEFMATQPKNSGRRPIPRK